MRCVGVHEVLMHGCAVLWLPYSSQTNVSIGHLERLEALAPERRSEEAVLSPLLIGLLRAADRLCDASGERACNVRMNRAGSG